MSDSALMLCLGIYVVGGCLLLVSYSEMPGEGKTVTYVIFPIHVLLYLILRPFVRAAWRIVGSPEARAVYVFTAKALLWLFYAVMILSCAGAR